MPLLSWAEHSKDISKDLGIDIVIDKSKLNVKENVYDTCQSIFGDGNRQYARSLLPLPNQLLRQLPLGESMTYTRRETMHVYTLIYQFQRRAQKERNEQALTAIGQILMMYLLKFAERHKKSM